jgi:glucose uptake protein GlcU
LLAIARAVSFLPKSKAERTEHLKRGMLILAAFGYVIFLLAGMDQGLGVFYRTLGYCWAALACALAGMTCASKKQRWFWGIAGVAAIVGNLYGHYQNGEWSERLARIQAQQKPPPTAQAPTNR